VLEKSPDLKSVECWQALDTASPTGGPVLMLTSWHKELNPKAVVQQVPDPLTVIPDQRTKLSVEVIMVNEVSEAFFPYAYEHLIVLLG
jgi:hypothetical protein